MQAADERPGRWGAAEVEVGKDCPTTASSPQGHIHSWGGEGRHATVLGPHLTWWSAPLASLGCNSKCEAAFAFSKDTLTSEGAGLGRCIQMREQFIGKCRQRKPTHQFQLFVGVQGSAFMLRPFLHSLQDVLGTRKVCINFHRPCLPGPPPAKQPPCCTGPNSLV